MTPSFGHQIRLFGRHCQHIEPEWSDLVIDDISQEEKQDRGWLTLDNSWKMQAVDSWRQNFLVVDDSTSCWLPSMQPYIFIKQTLILISVGLWTQFIQNVWWKCQKNKWSCWKVDEELHLCCTVSKKWFCNIYFFFAWEPFDWKDFIKRLKEERLFIKTAE